jgi:hypothetical protein
MAIMARRTSGPPRCCHLEQTGRRTASKERGTDNRACGALQLHGLSGSALGGIAGGLGMALLEEGVRDRRKGRVGTRTWSSTWCR